MTPKTSASLISLMSGLCISMKILLEQHWGDLFEFDSATLVPYITISLGFIVVFTLSMRQAVTMYVASIIALITIANFYLLPHINENASSLLDVSQLLISFVVLIPIFGLIKIPSHRVMKSILYLLGSLLAWGFFAFIIAKFEPLVTQAATQGFSAIGMENPFRKFPITELGFALLVVTSFTTLVVMMRSLQLIYLLAITVMAVHTLYFPSTLGVILLGLFGTLLCLCSAILNSRNMAFSDELTGIAGRRSLMQLSDELNHQYVIVMIDIDYFKRFNDKYGHSSGDDVLKLVATKINKTRNGAKGFRYGGEEFVVLFDGKHMNDIRETIENLRVEIESYPMAIRTQKRVERSASEARHRRQNPVRQQIVKVTCSFGIAETAMGSKDFKATLKRADIALYKAKKAGRNCVRTA
jgi:diguanylate cyclase (GGDEF)-like protein